MTTKRGKVRPAFSLVLVNDALGFSSSCADEGSDDDSEDGGSGDGSGSEEGEEEEGEAPKKAAAPTAAPARAGGAPAAALKSGPLTFRERLVPLAIGRILLASF